MRLQFNSLISPTSNSFDHYIHSLIANSTAKLQYGWAGRVSLYWLPSLGLLTGVYCSYHSTIASQFFATLCCFPPRAYSFPLGGVTAFGAMASHIPDGGHALVVYAPHVGVDSTGAVGTVERVGRAKGGACCGSAIAASAYVSNIYSGAAAKYGPALGNANEAICRKFFHSVDGNDDGLIDKSECSALLAKLNINLSSAEFETLYSELDTSGAGTISESEFSAWYARNLPSDNPQDAGAHQAKLTVDPTDAQQSFVGTMLLPHAGRLEAAENKMVELPFALFDAQKGLMDHIVKAGAANVAGKGKIAVLGGIQINTPNGGDDAMEDHFLPLSMEVYDHRGNVIFDDNDHP